VGASRLLFFRSEREGTLTVTNLYIKCKHGAALKEVSTFAFNQDGIGAGVACAPFRQVLIASRPILMECGLRPGELRENILLEDDRLYDLPSGTVVRIGRALIRLTFHCEPCKQILKLIAFDRIVHRRGVFGCFLNAGTIALGDELVVTDEKFEAIPYAVKERIRWFLSKGEAPAATRQLIDAIGLPSSFARGLPRLLEKLMPATR
jgi:MOSC domain-containing protein YiiM